MAMKSTISQSTSIFLFYFCFPKIHFGGKWSKRKFVTESCHLGGNVFSFLTETINLDVPGLWIVCPMAPSRGVGMFQHPVSNGGVITDVWLLIQAPDCCFKTWFDCLYTGLNPDFQLWSFKPNHDHTSQCLKANVNQLYIWNVTWIFTCNKSEDMFMWAFQCFSYCKSNFTPLSFSRCYFFFVFFYFMSQLWKGLEHTLMHLSASRLFKLFIF